MQAPKPPHDDTCKGCLLVGRNDLFGARMLPFLNALRLGHDYGLPVKIHWPSNGGDTTNIGQYKEVFSQEFLDTHFIDWNEFDALTKYAVALPKIRRNPVAQTIEMIKSGGIVALNGSVPALALGGEDVDQVTQSYRATLGRISFTPIVEQSIQKIKQATDGKPFLAYHVRHGDVTTSYRAKNKPWPNKFTPSDFFAHHFQTYVAKNDGMALLFGDFKPSLDWLCTQCDGVQQIGDVLDFGTLGSLQRDFLELYAMSRAEKIVGPRSSGFSQLAASLGGVPFQDIIDDFSPKDAKIAYEGLYNRIKNTPETLSSFGEVAQCLAHLTPYMMRHGQTSKIAALLKSEIERGNTISYLYPFLANAQMKLKNYEGVLEAREFSFSEPMFDPMSVASLDALCAQAAFKLGQESEATRLLAIAAFHTPYSPEVQRAYRMLDEDGLLNDEVFYPIDRIFLKLMHKGEAQFHPLYLAWEWRHSLISNFQRPLTFAGAAGAYIKKIDDAIAGVKLSTLQRARVDSFQSLVLMGLGHMDDALHLSIKAMDNAPQDPLVLKRHIQNLIQTRAFELALPYAQRLTEHSPKVLMYQLLLAECYVGAGKRKKAAITYDLANTQKPRFPGGALRHANLLLMAKEYDRAETVLNRMLPEARWPDQHLDVLTSVKIANGTQDALLPLLERLGDESYIRPKVSYMLSRIRLANGDLEGAERDAKRAISFAPNLPRLQEQLVRVYLSQEREQEAADLISQLPVRMQKRFK